MNKKIKRTGSLSRNIPKRRPSRRSSKMASLRVNFYSDRYEFVVIILIISIILNALFIYFVWYIYKNEPQPAYFAMNQSEVIGLVASKGPTVSNMAVLNSSMLVALRSTSVNFSDYKVQLKLLKPYFTPQGYKAFLGATQGNINRIVTQYLTPFSALTGPPDMQAPAKIGEQYFWTINLPLRIVFRSLSDSLTENYNLELKIQTVPVEESDQGFQIYSYNLKR